MSVSAPRVATRGVVRQLPYRLLLKRRLLEPTLFLLHGSQRLFQHFYLSRHPGEFLI
jgi:hypothetical protein